MTYGYKDFNLQICIYDLYTIIKHQTPLTPKIKSKKAKIGAFVNK